MSGLHEDTLVARFRRALGGGAATANGKRFVTRTEAAKLCAQALRRAGIAALPYAPRAEAGRVAVALFLLAAERRVPLGWIEIPLTGELVLHLDDSSVAAALASRVAEQIGTAFASLSVRPVPADARTWAIGDLRVAQAANGLWTVAAPGGAILAAHDTPEDAVRAAQAGPAVRGPRAAAADDLLVEMERDHAARWVTKQLREQGFHARADRDVITVTYQGLDTRILVSSGGLVFDSSVPSPARAVADAALRRVGLVEHLE